jgi:hypothetical protein
MMLVGLGVDLGGEQFIEEVGVGNFFFRRLLQARGKFVFDLIKPQPVAMFAQAVELRSANRSPPSPWLTSS